MQAASTRKDRFRDRRVSCGRQSLGAFLAVVSFLGLPHTAHAAPPSPKHSRPAAKHTALTAAPEAPFLFGCEWPVDGSPAVKSLFYETGCNFARLTGGGYGWTLDRHQRALQELDAHGIKVLLQLGSHYPDGGFLDLTDSYLVDQKGDSGKVDRTAYNITYNGSAWPQYSYASDSFRAKLAVDFTAYLDGLKEKNNVTALLLHNEPGYHWLDDRMFDYNPLAVARFRLWLHGQHGSLESLNQHWGSHWTSFDVVEPPHDLPPVASTAAWMDWRRFHADLIRDFLHSQVVFAHKTLPGVPATTNLSGALDNWYPIRLSDNYRYTADFDIAGIDVYPDQYSTSLMPGYALDMTRGAAQDRKIYVDECEVFDPSRFPGLSEDQRAGMLRSLVWTLIGHGADGILLWSLSGQGGFHLTDGEFNPRVGAVREIAHLAPMLHLETFHKPAPRIALGVDQDSFLFYAGQGTKMDGSYHADQSARNLYGALTASRYQADVVSAAQLRAGLGKRYQVLLLSLPVLMDAGLAAHLRAFVAGGGTLITEAPFAARDRWGEALPQAPGFGLGDVLGISNVRPAASEGGSITTASGTFGSQHRTQFTLAGAQVLGTFGDKTPAVTAHAYGKGTAISLAAEVGASNAWPSGPDALSHLAGSQTTASSGLQTFLAAILAKYAKLPPAGRLAYAGQTLIDSSLRRDGRDNTLFVLADTIDHAKPLPPATQVTLTPAAQDFSAGMQAFAFPPARLAGGRISAGPQPLPARRDGAGRLVLALPQISSALPVLLARDFSPLLTVSAPETAASGTELSVQVICYNPSPRPLYATLNLILPLTWNALDAPKPIVVPARGSQTVLLRVRSGGEARAVIGARLDYVPSGGPAAHLDSVPIDIYANTPPP